MTPIPSRPGWSLCIATLNRRDALLRTLEFALAQSCPPAQVVIVDVSDDWEDTAAEARALFADHGDIRLDYTTSAVRSSATQRNTGLELCTEEVVFLLDDDSFMYPDCAEVILDLYARDTEGAVAGVAARLDPDVPPTTEVGGPMPDRKSSGRRSGAGLKARIIKTPLGRWFNRKILLQNKDELFLKYDEPRRYKVPEALRGADVTPIAFMPGCAMTLRRKVALAEPFDPSLRYYAAFEDLDVAYRAARHGALLRAPAARLHHFEAAGGRVKRKKIIIFQLLNMVVFLKRHAADPDRFRGAYRKLVWRRLLGEALKDALSGRLGFPQTAGVITVMRQSRALWSRDVAELDAWYPEFQRKILDQL